MRISSSDKSAAVRLHLKKWTPAAQLVSAVSVRWVQSHCTRCVRFTRRTAWPLVALACVSACESRAAKLERLQREYDTAALLAQSACETSPNNTCNAKRAKASAAWDALVDAQR